MVNYKKKYEALKSQNNIDKKITEHKKKHIDHIHLFVGAKPKHTPFKIVKQLKGNTSIQLRRCFKHLPYLLWSYGKRFPNLWAKGYYCGSAGHVSQEAVKRYIQEQRGVLEYWKDQEI